MATNFGTKIAINTYQCTATRDNENVMPYNRGFRGHPIQKRHFCLQGSKAHCHGNQIMGKTGKKSQNQNFRCIWHVHATFGFETGFVLSGNSSQSSVTLLYTRDKGTLPWQPIFGLKLLWMHINAFLQETSGYATWITAGGAICIAHYDVIDDVITWKL